MNLTNIKFLYHRAYSLPAPTTQTIFSRPNPSPMSPYSCAIAATTSDLRRPSGVAPRHLRLVDAASTQAERLSVPPALNAMPLSRPPPSHF
jgi:hypothetical protein